jgi:hypothetical protein
VNAAAGRYEASWSLLDASFVTRRTYRIRALAGGAELGAVSVDVVRGRWALTQAGATAPLQSASALPIQFRVDRAAGGAITPAQRMAVIRAATDESRRLRAQGLRGAPYLTAFAAWLRARPEFEAAETTETGAWARFRDGRLFVTEDHLDYLNGTAAASAVAAPDVAAPTAVAAAVVPQPIELPWQNATRSLHAFGSSQRAHPVMQAYVNAVDGWLRAAAYAPVAVTPGVASVEALRRVSGDGFFHIMTHGTYATRLDGVQVYALGTSTPVSLAADTTVYRDDLENHRLAYALLDMYEGANGSGQETPVYAITPAFVTKYMSFVANSIVFLNACASASRSPNAALGPQAFVAALHGAGASVVFGWAGTVNIEFAGAAYQYLADRMLGANAFYPENAPPQRPFDWTAVLGDMSRHGLDVDPQTRARLVAMKKPTAAVVNGILRPSIAMVHVCTRAVVGECPDATLSIAGSFGKDPRSEGSVEVVNGGARTVLPVVRWDTSLIVARIPLTGLGSVGDVEVVSRGRRSNPRRIRAYQGTLDYALAWRGTLKQFVSVDVNARFDPAWFRARPGDRPADVQFGGTFSTVSPLPSVARYRAEGALTWDEGDCVVTVEWSGSGSVPVGAGTTGAGGPPFFWYDGTVSVDQKRLKLALFFRASYKETTTTVCPNGTTRAEAELPLVLSRTIDAVPNDARGYHDMVFALDDGLHVLAGSIPATPAGPFDPGVPFGATVSWKWNAMRATPDRNALQQY